MKKYIRIFLSHLFDVIRENALLINTERGKRGLSHQPSIGNLINTLYSTDSPGDHFSHYGG